MKYLLLVALIVFSSAVRIQERNVAKIQTELQKSTYGKALLHLVELHSMAGGAVQELIDAIEELINDLQEGLEKLDFDFQVRTNEHNSLVIGYEQDIQDAEIGTAPPSSSRRRPHLGHLGQLALPSQSPAPKQDSRY